MQNSLQLFGTELLINYVFGNLILLFIAYGFVDK